MFAYLCLAVGISVGISACSNNPFNPHSELRILDVASNETGRFAGIRQSVAEENGRSVIIYTYAEPVVKIENRAGFPGVNFSRFSAKISLADGTVLPTKEYPLTKGINAGTTSDVQLSIMSADRDLQNVVYPGNNAPRVRDGRAEVVVFGTDLNGNNVEVPFSVPLSFESTVFSDSPIPPTAPTATPSPEQPQEDN